MLPFSPRLLCLFLLTFEIYSNNTLKIGGHISILQFFGHYYNCN